MKMNRNHIWLLLPVLILAAGSVFAKQHNITECGTEIDQPGKYRLMNDLLDCPAPKAGVLIGASDVTLDLRGHTISCEQIVSMQAGVDVLWFENVRIRNGTVTGCDGGVVLFYSDNARVTKMSMSGNSSAIVLVGASNSLIKNNQFAGNIDTAIVSWWGISNLYSHNTMNSEFEGISLIGETDSSVTCNMANQTGFGISLGTDSTGNVLRGNQANDNISGIMLWGFGAFEDPDNIGPVPEDNLIRNNIALGNSWVDVSEVVYNDVTKHLFVHPDDTCRNIWMKNQFDMEMGPSNCIGLPVELDEDDVCALDADD